MTAAVLQACAAAPQPRPEPPPELYLYRPRTCAMLRRYFRMSIELGRLPSLVGREFFRSRVTSYRAASFEDLVIFVHDVERCLERLDEFSREVISRVVLQEFAHHEAARLLRCGARTVARRLPEALDELTQIFLETGLLRRLPETPKKSCQEGKTDEIGASE